MKGICTVDESATTSDRQFNDCTPIRCGECPRFKGSKAVAGKKPRILIADLLQKLFPCKVNTITQVDVREALQEAWSRGYAARMDQES